ncbi:MAG: hypothetical protein CM1200mP27_01110 [Chloroflexota bacterium]|nr:MAG: hypothetical protein CM1200mP27_01110 [Chloroflexota bacterium]
MTCGVSYDSDLDLVEEVSREVMDDLLQNDDNAVKSYGSWFAFNAFGESNVDFWLFLQARDRIPSFNLQSALIKNLHRRFITRVSLSTTRCELSSFPTVLTRNRGVPLLQKLNDQPDHPVRLDNRGNQKKVQT